MVLQYAMRGVWLASAGLAAAASVASADVYYPQMIHLSLTGVDGEMAVDWISSCPDNTSVLSVADNGAMARATEFAATDHASAYVDLKMLHTNYTLHYAKMSGVKLIFEIQQGGP